MISSHTLPFPSLPCFYKTFTVFSKQGAPLGAETLCIALSYTFHLEASKRIKQSFRPSTPRNLIKGVLTSCQKLMQLTALEQKRFDCQLLLPALRNFWSLLAYLI